MTRWLVVGGGFRGIVAAWELARTGQRVTLVEKAPALGGILRGTAWEGCSLDFGCHLFGNEDDEITSIMLDLMRGEVVPVDLRVASRFRGRLTPGVELPNLADGDRGTIATILLELCTAAAHGPPRAAHSLEDLLLHRYGPTATRLLDGCVRKMLGTGAGALGAAAWAATPFRRLLLLAPEVADLLKQVPELDDRLARPSPRDPMRYYRRTAGAYPARAFYPASGGMAGFSARAATRLEELGVALRPGRTVARLAPAPRQPRAVLDDGEVLAVDQVLWTADHAYLERALGRPETMRRASHAVPMVLVHFKVPAAQLPGRSYAQDFDAASLCYRISAPSTYGPGTAPDGFGHVCCEIPTPLDAPVWREPEAFVADAWAQALALGIAEGAQPARHTVARVPVSYRMPTLAAAELRAALERELAALPWLRVTDEWAFGKNLIVRDVRRALAAAA